jgi:hypothetical protein
MVNDIIKCWDESISVREPAKEVTAVLMVVLRWGSLDIGVGGRRELWGCVCGAGFIDELGAQSHPAVVACHFELIEFKVEGFCFLVEFLDDLVGFGLHFCLDLFLLSP